MYLAGIINDVLESKKDKIVGRSTYFYITGVLNRAFSKTEPFKFRFETYEDYGRDDYSVSGIFDMETNTRYVILNFPKSCKTFTVKPERWEEFKFSISQVCQHEAIHQCQWQHRDSGTYEVGKLDFRDVDGTIDEEKEYLADLDEIDAYGHDIAMEIKFFYPKEDPYRVLERIHTKRKLWSYNYYKKTFKGDDWSQIKHRLYKKVHKWLPYTTI
jgi:hypothetical protein